MIYKKVDGIKDAQAQLILLSGREKCNLRSTNETSFMLQRSNPHKKEDLNV